MKMPRDLNSNFDVHIIFSYNCLKFELFDFIHVRSKFKIFCLRSFAFEFEMFEPKKNLFVFVRVRLLNRTNSNELEQFVFMGSSIWSIEWFRVYLYGRPIFYVHTDNTAVKFLFQGNHARSRLNRWHWALQEYNFEVIHKKGTTNNVADALSRAEIENPYDIPSKSIFLVQTRSKTNQVSEKDDTTGIADNNGYFIEESNNLLTSCRDYDHIFFSIKNIAKCTGNYSIS